MPGVSILPRRFRHQAFAAVVVVKEGRSLGAELADGNIVAASIEPLQAVHV
jgi:hypothetical protein